MTSHAVLILAHTKPTLVERQFELLDHPDIDFFIHLDRRYTIREYQQLEPRLRHSTVRFATRRRAANWGSHGATFATMDLLSEATQRKYGYYHLISGVDLPLKSGSAFVDHFRSSLYEYVHFSDNTDVDWLRYYYPLQQFARRGSRSGRFLIGAQKRILRAQRAIGVNRLSSLDIQPRKGSQWFSITHDFARHLVERDALIRKMSRHSFVPDELFVTTLLAASPFESRRDLSRPEHSRNLRLINFSRSDTPSSPCIWRSDDRETILRSDCLFARKFDPDDLDFIASLTDEIRRRG